MTAVAPAPASIDELAGVYAHRITAALPLLWARRVSMHDSRGVVRWQSADVWGPAERDAVRLALERFVGMSAPTRADHELPEQRTAVLLRAADGANVFRGFIMLVVDNRRLRGKGQSAHDLPIPVQRAAHDWAVRLAAIPNADGAAGNTTELSPGEADRLLAFGPTVDDAQVDQFFARLRALPVSLVAQPLTPLQRGMRIRRYEVFLREGSPSVANSAPVALLREADEKGLGAVIDRRVVGALIVWLAERGGAFAEEPSQFSVNLSASSVSDPNFLRFVELCVAKARIPPALLAFEVDESHLRRARERVERLARGLEAIGAGLVIDNCVLQADTPELLGLPGVRLAKFDRPLTQELGTSRIAQMRLAGLAQIARVAGVHTVAKRVERPEEQELLRATGIDFIQGHATAIPLPLEMLDRERELRIVIDDNVRETDAETASETADSAASPAR
jgi:EAL domain-containing protein (putative c-di-GMP-specific phosphodiesterase class I)